MVKVPTYSQQGGEVGLPTRRFTGISGQGIQNLMAPGRALEQAGRQINAAATNVMNYQMDQDKKEAKMWVMSAEANLREDMAALQNDLEAEIDLQNYMNDESFRDGSSPNTFSNRLMSGFDQILSSSETGEDGSTTSKYQAPNQFAEELWSTQREQLRSSYNVNAMNYEASVRSAAKLQQLEKSLDSYFTLATMEPEKIDELMLSVESLKDLDDNDDTNMAGLGGIKQKDLIGVSDAAANKLVYSATQGLIRDDPFMAYAILTDNKLGANHPLNKHKHHLTAPELITLSERAKVAASVVSRKDLATLRSTISQHVVSLTSGGDGYAPYNTEVGLENAIANVFGGEYGQIKLQILPDLKDLATEFYNEFVPKIKVARKVGQFSNAMGGFTQEKLVELGTRLNQLLQTGEVRDDIAILDLLTSNGADEIIPGITDLGTTDLAAFIDLVMPQITQQLTTRSEDPALAAFNLGVITGPQDDDLIQKMLLGGEIKTSFINEGHIQGNPLSTPFGKWTGSSDQLDQINAVYAQWGVTRPEIMPILPKGEAQKLVAQGLASTGEDRANFLDQLNKEFPDHYEQVLRQLTTMKGGLGLDFQVISAFGGKTNSGLMLGLASSADAQILTETLNKNLSGSGRRATDYEQAAYAINKDLVMSFTGGILGREGISAELTELLVKAVMQEGLSKNISPQAAAANVRKTLDEQITVAHEEGSYSYYVIKGVHKTSNNEAVIPEYVQANVESLLDTQGELVEFIINNQVQIPGSISGEVSRDIAFQREFFSSYLKQHAEWVMSDDSNGLMLVYPALAGSEGASTGAGVKIPVENTDGKPITIPWEYLNFPQRPGWYRDNAPTWLGGLDQSAIDSMILENIEGVDTFRRGINQ
tara:strand:- start:8776 stop:11406 length:2631 start_codon:yes stop_codon:yes gene_type:complete